MTNPSAYRITTLDQPPVVLRPLFSARTPDDGVTRYDYTTTDAADAATMARTLMEYNVHGSLIPPTNTRSTSARAVSF
jgi:hypothetical protein